MLGAIIGDISGSRFEHRGIKTKSFDLFTHSCEPTDDSVMSLAIAKAILDCNEDFSDLGNRSIERMQEYGKKYPRAGYGGSFIQWIHEDNPKPYNSFGNGAAMRVSACGFAAKSIDEAKQLAKEVTVVSHNHPEGMKAAEAVSVAIYMALHGSNILEIQDLINKEYYKIDFKLDDIRDDYAFDVTCQGSVPQAFAAFFESNSFEDAIRNAISIGGDSDTIAAITGGMAEAYYGIPADLRKYALTFLDEFLLKTLMDFENKYKPQMEVNTKESTYSITREDNVNVKGTSRVDLLVAANEATKQDEMLIETETNSLASNRLFAYLYGACSVLHGYIGKENYRSYVIPMLFFKRLSDVYDEETAECIKQYGEDGAAFMGESAHTFIIPDGCHWNDLRNVSENVGKAIADALASIEQANPKTLSGVFSSFDDADWANKTILSDELMKNLIEHMSKINVGNSDYSADVMGDAYEYLLKQFAENAKKNGGEFYTPRAVVKLLVKILDPKAGETILYGIRIDNFEGEML